MNFKTNLALVLSMLLVALPVLSAEPSAAIGKITARGAAEVNGTALPNEATIFSGDRLTTRKDSAVALSLGGGNQVFFPELTRARVEHTSNGTNVSLESGALAVISRSGNVPIVETGGVRIQATGNSPAIFEVAINGADLKVFTRTGTARVTSADRNIDLPEGKMLEAKMAPLPQAPAAGTGMTSGLTTLQTVAIVAGVAGGIAGITMGAIALTRPNPKDCTITGSSPATITCP